MLIEKNLVSPSSDPLRITPATPSEYINLLSHYYRGEMARMMSWRDRLDRTTNWAIAGVAAMLSVSLSTPTSHHGVLLFAIVLIYLLLHIESRRYRFFHVYRTRVRLLERCYYAQIFAPQEGVEARAWLAQIGNDLRAPRFTITLHQAMGRRLRRNYIWIFLILLLAWLLKTTSIMLQFHGSPSQFIRISENPWRTASLGGLPGEAVVAGLALFYGWLTYLSFTHREVEGELTIGEVHV
jgi:uncharacterized membrane protein